MRSVNVSYGIEHLNKMFGYNTPIPDAPTTRHHRLGVYSSGFKRTNKDEERLAQQKKPKDPKDLTDFEKQVLNLVQRSNGITGIIVSEKTGRTHNHCSIVLGALSKRGLIKRVKRATVQTRTYEYFKIDPA